MRSKPIAIDAVTWSNVMCSSCVVLMSPPPRVPGLMAKQAAATHAPYHLLIYLALLMLKRVKYPRDDDERVETIDWR